MLKKILTAGLFIIPVAFPVVASANFWDVSSSNPYATAIQYAQQHGIVAGYSDGRFFPERYVNRAEFLKILMKTKHKDSEITSCTGGSFKDVPANEWYSPYVCFAKKNNIVSGYDDGTFRPEESITFVEGAKIISNTMLPSDELSVDPSFTQWYQPYVRAISDHHAIPVAISSFSEFLSRGEMVEMIYRLDAKVTTQPSLLMNEINDRKIIGDYYSAISFKDYDLAYNLKYAPTMSLDDFKKTYTDFPYVGATHFEKTGPSTYKFKVMTNPNIMGNADGSPKPDEKSELYLVEMQVIDGKLKTISSTQVDTDVLEKITQGDTTATLEWNQGSYEVYVTKNGKKTLLDEYDTQKSMSISLSDLAFSPTGNYLIFSVQDWEYGGIVLVDTNDATHNEHMAGADYYGFTTNDKNFYFCSESGMGSGDLKVVTLPNFDTTGDFTAVGMSISGCGPYDPATRTLHYQLTGNTNGTAFDKTYVIPS